MPSSKNSSKNNSKHKKHGLIKRSNAKMDRDPNAAMVVVDRWNDAARAFGSFQFSGDQLKAFAAIQGSDDEPWDVMLQTLAMDESSALKLLADRTGLEFIAEPKLKETSAAFYELIAQEDARTYATACTEKADGAFVLITSRPMQPSVLSILEDTLDAPITVILTPRAAVASLINRGYEQRGDLVTEIVEDIPLDQDTIEKAAGAIGKSNDLLAQARQTPVIRLVNMILFEALRRGASDVHVHPMEERLSIRLRIDGMLVDAFSPPLSLASAISSRLKVMTELDIANRHSPQDGQTTVRIGQKKIDIRLSVIPTIFGERIVLRLLDQSQTELDLNAVGMSKKLQTKLMDCVERPNGILLVTGPTGSGKTTTLYAALGRIDRASRNVMTIEDPVEYHLDGISQMQVNVKRGVTFATGLRSLLRQDPDVILVGEIRDSETAQLAIQASLTGHFVLATLHTNDAPSAIPRLLDIGVEPYLVTSSLVGVLAQRLMRRLCTTCKGAGTHNGESCELCFGSGYKGRLAVHELMLMNDELRQLTATRADGVTLYETAVNTGFEPMKLDAMEKVAQGLTDEAEVFRVLH